MIRALLLDLGNTLIDSARKPFPGVKAALDALQKLETADHTPLVLCLVSDVDIPDPRNEAAIAAAFAEYLLVLDQAGLRSYFEPVDERVTLSIHVGVYKPDAGVFEAALQRARVDAPLTVTLFITEQPEHIQICRDLHKMKTLQFGKDFTTWSAAPGLIEEMISAPGS